MFYTVCRVKPWNNAIGYDKFTSKEAAINDAMLGGGCGFYMNIVRKDGPLTKEDLGPLMNKPPFWKRWMY